MRSPAKRADMKPYGELTYRGQMGRVRRVAESALEQFEVGAEACRMTPLRHLENTTFRIDAPANGERFCLRVHRPGYRSTEAIRSELDWLAALGRDTDLHVPEPVPAHSGDYVTLASAPGLPEGEPPRRVVLFRWVYGRFVRSRMTPGLMERVGAFMARLHNHAESFQPPAGFERPQLEAEVFLGRTWEDSLTEAAPYLTPEGHALLRAAWQYIRAAQTALSETPDVFGLIHADLHRSNFLIGPGGEIRAIDFDDCGWAHYLTDIAATNGSLLSYPHYADLRAALLRGYRRVRPLPVEHESELLPAFILARRILLLRWFLTRTDNPRLRERIPAFVEGTLKEVQETLGKSTGSAVE